MLLATGEIGVDLTGQKRVLGDVGLPRVIVEGKEKQPDDTSDNTDKRKDMR